MESPHPARLPSTRWTPDGAVARRATARVRAVESPRTTTSRGGAEAVRTWTTAGSGPPGRGGADPGEGRHHGGHRHHRHRPGPAVAPELPAQHRPLHGVVAEGGQAHRHPQVDRHQGGAGHVDPGRRERHPHREVPEIDAVADQSEPGQRPHRQRPVERGARAVGQRGQHHGGEHGHHQEAAAEQRRRAAVDPHRHQPDGGQGSRADGAAGGPGDPGAPRRPARDGHRGQGQRGRRPVRTARGCRCRSRGGWWTTRPGSRGASRPGWPPPPPPPDQQPADRPTERPDQPEDGQDQHGPHQVELLLDGQGPGVGQRRHRPGGHEVVGGGGDLVPVGHVQEGGQGVAAVPGVGAGQCHVPHEGGHRHQHHQQGGEEPTGPPRPEAAQAHRAGPLELPDQEPGDEEPGEHVEHVDPEEAAGRPGHPEVERAHRQHRHAPEAVQGPDPPFPPGSAGGRDDADVAPPHPWGTASGARDHGERPPAGGGRTGLGAPARRPGSASGRRPVTVPAAGRRPAGRGGGSRRRARRAPPA